MVSKAVASVEIEPGDLAPTRRAGSGWGARLLEALAVGGLTLLLFPLAWLLRERFGLDRAELAVGFTMFHAAHFLNDPHFAVTYLLFYRAAPRRALDPAVPPAQRARYVVAGLVVPPVLVAWAGLSLHLRSPRRLARWCSSCSCWSAGTTRSKASACSSCSRLDEESRSAPGSAG